MGNRAIIATTRRDVAIYVHWNGGYDSVAAFTEYCRLRRFRAPERDDYGLARMCQVMANFFGPDGSSVGILPYTTDELMAGYGSDNGVYFVDGWHIAGRVYPYENFTEQGGYDLKQFLKDIDESQPEHQRLGEFLDAEEVPTSDIRPGDTAFVWDVGGWRRWLITHIGKGRFEGMPYSPQYGCDACPYDENPNNYLREPSYRVIRREER